jgi:hypothetical protein
MEHIFVFSASELSFATFTCKSHSFDGSSVNTKESINTHKTVRKTGVLYSCLLSVPTAPDSLHLSFIVYCRHLQNLTILKHSYVLNNRQRIFGKRSGSERDFLSSTFVFTSPIGITIPMLSTHSSVLVEGQLHINAGICSPQEKERIIVFVNGCTLHYFWLWQFMFSFLPEFYMCRL